MQAVKYLGARQVKYHWFAWWKANQWPPPDTILFCSSQQLARLRLRPLKGVLKSWHGALQYGPWLTLSVASGTTEIQGHHQVCRARRGCPRTLSRTTDGKPWSSVFWKRACFHCSRNWVDPCPPWPPLIHSEEKLTWSSHINCEELVELSWCAHSHGRAKTFWAYVAGKTSQLWHSLSKKSTIFTWGTAQIFLHGFMLGPELQNINTI